MIGPISRLEYEATLLEMEADYEAALLEMGLSDGESFWMKQARWDYEYLKYLESL